MAKYILYQQDPSVPAHFCKNLKVPDAGAGAGIAFPGKVMAVALPKNKIIISSGDMFMSFAIMFSLRVKNNLQ